MSVQKKEPDRPILDLNSSAFMYSIFNAHGMANWSEDCERRIQAFCTDDSLTKEMQECFTRMLSYRSKFIEAVAESKAKTAADERAAQAMASVSSDRVERAVPREEDVITISDDEEEQQHSDRRSHESIETVQSMPRSSSSHSDDAMEQSREAAEFADRIAMAERRSVLSRSLPSTSAFTQNTSLNAMTEKTSATSSFFAPYSRPSSSSVYPEMNDKVAEKSRFASTISDDAMEQSREAAYFAERITMGGKNTFVNSTFMPANPFKVPGVNSAMVGNATVPRSSTTTPPEAMDQGRKTAELADINTMAGRPMPSSSSFMKNSPFDALAEKPISSSSSFMSNPSFSAIAAEKSIPSSSAFLPSSSSISTQYTAMEARAAEKTFSFIPPSVVPTPFPTQPLPGIVQRPVLASAITPNFGVSIPSPTVSTVATGSTGPVSPRLTEDQAREFMDELTKEVGHLNGIKSSSVVNGILDRGSSLIISFPSYTFTGIPLMAFYHEQFRKIHKEAELIKDAFIDKPVCKEDYLHVCLDRLIEDITKLWERFNRMTNRDTKSTPEKAQSSTFQREERGGRSEERNKPNYNKARDHRHSPRRDRKYDNDRHTSSFRRSGKAKYDLSAIEWCAFCVKMCSHPSEDCPAYRTYPARQQRRKDLKLCYHCMENFGDQCVHPDHKVKCKFCGKHDSHISLCKDFIEGRRPLARMRR